MAERVDEEAKIETTRLRDIKLLFLCSLPSFGTTATHPPTSLIHSLRTAEALSFLMKEGLKSNSPSNLN